MEERLRVSETLRGAHPLVSQTLHALEHVERNANGILQRPKQDSLDVVVSRGSLHRALCIMDALLKAFEADGYRVRLTEKEPSETVVELMDVVIPFGISESLVDKQEEKPPEDKLEGRYTFHHSLYQRKLVPSGALSLRIEPGQYYYWNSESGLRRKWSDGKKQRLEDRLASFCDGVVKMAEAKHAGKLRREEEERQSHAAQKRREEMEQIRATMWEKIQSEQTRVNQLLADATHWQRSKLLRDYIQTVREAALARGETLADHSETGQWIKWATEQADRLDPLRPSPPSILDDKEKYKPAHGQAGSRWV